MRMHFLVVATVLSCKSADREKTRCLDAVDKARLAWISVADSERSLMDTQIEKAFESASKANDEWERVLHLGQRIGCTRTNTIVVIKKLENFSYIVEAAAEAKDAVAAARELAASASASDKATIAADTTEVEKALPEMEKLLAAAKPDSAASPALLAAAQKVAEPCSRLFRVGAAMTEAAEKAAKDLSDKSSTRADEMLAEQQRHFELLRAALDAARAISETVRPGTYDVPKELQDPKYADAQQKTSAVKDACK